MTCPLSLNHRATGAFFFYMTSATLGEPDMVIYRVNMAWFWGIGYPLSHKSAHAIHLSSQPTIRQDTGKTKPL